MSLLLKEQADREWNVCSGVRSLRSCDVRWRQLQLLHAVWRIISADTVGDCSIDKKLEFREQTMRKQCIHQCDRARSSSRCSSPTWPCAQPHQMGMPTFQHWLNVQGAEIEPTAKAFECHEFVTALNRTKTQQVVTCMLYIGTSAVVRTIPICKTGSNEIFT